MIQPCGVKKRVFFQVFAGRKVKVPAIPVGVGPWLQMTGALQERDIWHCESL